MIRIPKDFTDTVLSWGDDDATRWLLGLPELAAEYLDRWDLTPDGAPLNGFCSVVQPVRLPDGRPAMLKLGLLHEESEHEWLALSLWDGDGAVRLLAHDADDGVLLLERLRPECLTSQPIEQALVIAGTLRKRLRRPAPHRMRTLRASAARWAEKLPRAEGLPRRIIDEAVDHCRTLGPVALDEMVNEDQHFDNILAGDREPWLVIDPKVLAGDPEFGLATLLWNRFEPDRVEHRLATLVEIEELDAAKARAWTFVSAVVNWADADGWVNDTCQAIATTLAAH
ncbi:aminoglycoside phosphotransferase family protein [Kutzneria sp. CA-103260]|uniref:aminoglycoside phosphotransferase family protein n=1 Tax=Kutzneria sp. CA-103260 TaxID=2802641 RepID=UPI001BA6E297|nr:aminoglycoside phosphotransferase family protein [Kutzneria sp. CA-103260]QUQ69059.1 aminoglycoside O-phosphotransferase [Kutzneria sp. CA-103260]